MRPLIMTVFVSADGRRARGPVSPPGVPLLLGAGRRLFSTTDKDATQLELVEHAAYDIGVQPKAYDAVRL